MHVLKKFLDATMKGLLYAVTYLLATVLSFGIGVYILVRYNDVANFQAFELATITALLGGFALTGGFSTHPKLVRLTFALRKTGALYIISTISFVGFGLFYPLGEASAPAPNFATWLAICGYALGGLTFTFANWLFMLQIPKIFKEN